MAIYSLACEENNRFAQCVTKEEQAIAAEGIGSINSGLGWIRMLLFSRYVAILRHAVRGERFHPEEQRWPWDRCIPVLVTNSDCINKRDDQSRLPLTAGLFVAMSIFGGRVVYGPRYVYDFVLHGEIVL